MLVVSLDCIVLECTAWDSNLEINKDLARARQKEIKLVAKNDE